MEVRCKDNCPCCEISKECVGFQKILDLKNAGLVIYRHSNRTDEVNKTTGLLKSCINTRDDIFVVHNTKDIQIKADDWISEIDQGISCARCRELVQRAKKYLQNVPPLDKRDIISVCDHCQQNRIKKRFFNNCYKCHEVLKKYHAEEIKQITAKEQIKSWLSNFNKFGNVLTDKNTKKSLKCRSHSELYLDKICNTAVKTDRHLEVRPMLQKGVRMTESIHSIDNDTKSESALKFTDSEYIRSKSVLIRADSLLKIESYVSPSVTTYDMSLIEKSPDKNEAVLKPTTSQIIKGILQRDTEFAHKIKSKLGKSPSKLRKYYSDEDIFFSASGLADYDIDKNFSYVFPKGSSDKVRPLRRVKTSAELIADTQEMLRQRAMDEKNKFQAQKKILPTRKLRSGEKRATTSDDEDSKKVKKKKSAESEKNKKAKSDEESEKTKKGKTEDESEKIKKSKEIKSDKERVTKDQKPKQEPELRTQEKTDQIRKDKEEKLRLLEEKKKEQERLKKEKEEKQREKQEQLRKEKDLKQKLKEEQQKMKEEKERIKKMEKAQTEPKQKTDSSNIKKQQNEDQDTLKMEADKKRKEEAERKLKALEETTDEKKHDHEKPKVNKTQEDHTNKDLNIKQIKMRNTSPDDLILQLVRLRQSLRNKDGERPKRLSEINISPIEVNEHKKIHKNKKMLNCAMCLDSDLEMDVENILNTKAAPEATDIIVGNKMFKCKHPLREKIQSEEIIPILYKSLYNEETALTQEREHIEKITNLKEHKPSPVSHKYVS